MQFGSTYSGVVNLIEWIGLLSITNSSPLTSSHVDSVVYFFSQKSYDRHEFKINVVKHLL